MQSSNLSIFCSPENACWVAELLWGSETYERLEKRIFSLLQRDKIEPKEGHTRTVLSFLRVSSGVAVRTVLVVLSVGRTTLMSTWTTFSTPRFPPTHWTTCFLDFRSGAGVGLKTWPRCARLYKTFVRMTVFLIVFGTFALNKACPVFK